MKVILISGKAEAGKTTTANIIKTFLGAHWKKVACIPYGQYVKDTAKLIWNWDGEKDKKGRELLQWWGTDIVRAQDPNFWVDSVVRLAKVIDKYVDYLIVDDCRFINEIEAWRAIKYVALDSATDALANRQRFSDIIAIRVERPGHENALTPEQRRHPSETELDDYIFDITIKAIDKAGLYDEVIWNVMPKI